MLYLPYYTTMLYLEIINEQNEVTYQQPITAAIPDAINQYALTLHTTSYPKHLTGLIYLLSTHYQAPNTTTSVFWDELRISSSFTAPDLNKKDYIIDTIDQFEKHILFINTTIEWITNYLSEYKSRRWQK